MIQIKVVTGMTVEELQTAANEFLTTLQDEAVKDVKINAPEGIATILYVYQEEWENHMCCDCQYWDDGGEMTTSGICHECGKRRRFNNKACKCFKDVRG